MKKLPATSPSGKPRVRLLVGGDRHTAGRAPSLARGRWEHQSLLHPQSTNTRQTVSPLAPLGEGEKGKNTCPSGWAISTSGLPPGLPLHLPPAERTVSLWARNHYYMRDGHYTSGMRKLGQGSGTIKTAANLLPRLLLGVIPPGSGRNSTPCGFLPTEARFQRYHSQTTSWLHTLHDCTMD